MLKGLAITPPVVGRISIGRVVEKNGKRLPEKDDQFTITTQVQTKEGWVLHPLDEALRKGRDGKDANAKLRSIPVRVLFNNPNLNLRAEYSAFDKQSGRPICVGDGERCRRVTDKGLDVLPCPAPEGCAFGAGRCKPYGRLNVVVGDEDDLGTFIFRTTSFNSIRTLAARLSYFQAASGDLLASLPLELKLRGKSTTQSHRAPIYYVDLVVRSGSTMESAISQAKERAEIRKAAGFNQSALDDAAKEGFSKGTFEESAEEAEGMAEEFFAAESHATSGEVGRKTSLNEKLEMKLLPAN